MPIAFWVDYTIKVSAISLAIYAASLTISDTAFAHSGKTYAEGCHNDRKRGGYNCHGGAAAKAAQKNRVAETETATTTRSRYIIPLCEPR